MLAALAMNQMELRLYAEKVARLEHAERTISEQLREANERLGQSEERFRDYFEEAPIAYVVSSKGGIISGRIARPHRSSASSPKRSHVLTGDPCSTTIRKPNAVFAKS